jgi:hypothetical protein
MGCKRSELTTPQCSMLWRELNGLGEQSKINGLENTESLNFYDRVIYFLTYLLINDNQ